MIFVYHLSVFFILIIPNPLENDLPEVDVNNFVALSLGFSGLFLPAFDRFFLSRFILISYFISYVFLQLTLLVLMERFCLNAHEGYRSLFFKHAG